MKEIIKKILVGILAVGIVIGAAVYRFVLYDPNKANETTTQPTVTDAEGTTYYAVTNPDGSMMVIVTNESGEQYKAEFDGENVGSTVEAVSEGEVEGALPTNYTGPHLNVESTSSQKADEADTDSAATTNKKPSGVTTTNTPGTTKATTTKAPAQQNTTKATTTKAPAQQTTTKEATTKAPAKQTTTKATATGNKVDIYQTVFASGNFLMEVNDPDLGAVTMAMKGNKMYVEASMEGMSLELVYNGDIKDKDHPDGTWYLMLDSLKKYSTMPSEMLGDMNVSELTKDFAKDDGNLVYTTSVEDVDGALLVCESTVDNNGNTLKYYFDGDVLVRSDTVAPDGSVSTTRFSKITTEVPDDLFTIPAGYSYINLEWLMNSLA